MSNGNDASGRSSLGGPLEGLLSETSGMLDALSRSSRSLFGTREDDAPNLIGGMKDEKEQLESRLINRMRELIPYLDAIKAETKRCDHNLEVLHREREELNLSETKEQFERAVAAQEAQLQRASRQWPEVLDMIIEIAVDLQWAHGLPARRPNPHAASPIEPTSAPIPGPAAGPTTADVDGLVSIGPLSG